MELGLKGKVAAVTGGSEGIGRATVERLVKEGAKVALCARRAEVLNAFADELRKAGGEVLAIVADATKEGDMERFIDETVRKYGRVDIVVNNAGGTGQEAFEKVDDAAWQSDFDVKVFAQIRTARAAVPHMKKNGGGRIINLNMVGAKAPFAGVLPDDDQPRGGARAHQGPLEGIRGRQHSRERGSRREDQVEAAGKTRREDGHLGLRALRAHRQDRSAGAHGRIG